MFKLVVIVVFAALAAFINAEMDLSVKAYHMCPEFPDTPVKVYATWDKQNETMQLLSANGSTPYNIGDNIVMHLSVDMLENGTWNSILNLDEKDPCKLLNDYVGEMWHQIEGELGIPPGECPIPKGAYKVKDYVVDFAKMTFQAIPKGYIRVKLNATQEDELALCMYAEFESN